MLAFPDSWKEKYVGLFLYNIDSAFIQNHRILLVGQRPSRPSSPISPIEAQLFDFSPTEQTAIQLELDPVFSAY